VPDFGIMPQIRSSHHHPLRVSQNPEFAPGASSPVAVQQTPMPEKRKTTRIANTTAKIEKQ
jgi:hypothetical protein